MILATGWPIKNSPIAAPDRNNLVPMSVAEYPNVVTHPPLVHAVLRPRRRLQLVSTTLFPSLYIVLVGVSGPASGTVLNARWTSEARRSTGHIMTFPVLSCVLLWEWSLV
jgi:hypothetical protein